MIGKSGLFRWGARVAAGVAGYYVSSEFISPNLPGAGKTFLGLPVVSGPGKIGWDDVCDVAIAITTAGYGGRLVGGKKKK